MNTDTSGSTESIKAEALNSAALARRHMLLKGLGKGTAVLAASVPLQTLASQSVFTYDGPGTATQIRCGVSGMTSGIHSRDVTTTQCMGYSPGYYKTHDWPAGVNKTALITTVCSRSTLKTYVCTETTKVKGVETQVVTRSRESIDFKNERAGSCTVVNSTLFDVIDFHENTDEFHWVCAWLNAMGGAPAGWNFPYTGAEVIAFYDNNASYPVGKSPLDFFKTYMEKHPG